MSGSEGPSTAELGAPEGRPAPGTDRPQLEDVADRFLHLSLDLVAIADLDRRFRRVNPAFAEVLGYTQEEILERTYLDFVHPEDLERTKKEADRLRKDQAGTRGFENRYRCKDGTYRWLLWSSQTDQVRGLVYTMAKDVTDRKVAEEHLAESEAMLADAQQVAAVGSFSWDVASGAIRWSDELYRIMGLQPQEFEPTYESYLEKVHPDDRATLTAIVQTALEDGRAFELDHGVVRPDGEVRTVHCRGHVLCDEDQERRRVVGTAQDVTERREFERQLAHQALHDSLTDLPNRTLLLDRLTQAIARVARHERRLAVLFIDVDNFKLVNDSLGHPVGDRLLIDVGERLRGTLRSSDTVARFGGDEYVMLCEELRDARDAAGAAARVRDAFDEPFTLEGQDHQISASIGVAVASSPAASSDDLLRDADTAMYNAKELGPGRFELFDEEMHARALQRLRAGRRPAP